MMDVEKLRELAVVSNDGNLRGPALQASTEIETLRAALLAAEQKHWQTITALLVASGGEITVSKFDMLNLPDYIVRKSTDHSKDVIIFEAIHVPKEPNP